MRFAISAKEVWHQMHGPEQRHEVSARMISNAVAAGDREDIMKLAGRALYCKPGAVKSGGQRHGRAPRYRIVFPNKLNARAGPATSEVMRAAGRSPLKNANWLLKVLAQVPCLVHSCSQNCSNDAGASAIDQQ